MLGLLSVLARRQRRVGGTAIRHEKFGPQLHGSLETRQSLARILEMAIGLAEVVVDVGVVRIALQRPEEIVDRDMEIAEHAGDHAEQHQGLRMRRIELQHGAIDACSGVEILGLLMAYTLGHEGIDPLRRLAHALNMCGPGRADVRQ